MLEARTLLLEIYAAGLAAVHGEQAVYQVLVVKGQRQPTHVVAIGKAAEAMFGGAMRYFHNDLSSNLQSSLIITKHGHISASFVAAVSGVSDQVQVLEAAHPVPDASSLQAGQALLNYLAQLPEQANLLFLLSGGASSLVEVLADDWSLEKLQAKTQELLANGSSISEINAMRRQLSCIKGGKLWQYLGKQRVDCLLISDVPADDPHIIGSGLLFPPPSGADFAWQIVASNQQMLQAMAQVARDVGQSVTIMPDFLENDAVTAARTCIQHLQNSPAGLYLWGGETTVVLPDNAGHGGRNQHFALAAALEIAAQTTDDAAANLYLLAAGSDGTDGATDDAGALIDRDTCQRGKDENLDPIACLQNADSGTFLAASGDLIHTGATGTNVMDVVIGLKL